MGFWGRWPWRTQALVIVAVVGLAVSLFLVALVVGYSMGASVESASRDHQRPSTESQHGGVRGIPTGSQKVVVVGHTDGDTITVRLAHDGVAGPAGRVVSVRLLEIDTPESNPPGQPVQCYAAEASIALARLMPMGTVAWAEADRELLDRYGRTLLYLRTTRGNHVTFVNQRLVEQGFAIAVLYEPNDRYIDVMRTAQARAERRGPGLWSACGSFGEPE